MVDPVLHLWLKFQRNIKQTYNYEINAHSPKDHSKFFHHPASDVTVVQKKDTGFTTSYAGADPGFGIRGERE
jgi:hypothetical protein